MIFNLQLFCGGGTTVQQVPLTAEQKALIAAGLPAAKAGGALSAKLLNQFDTTINSGKTGVVTPDYQTLTNNINNIYSDINKTASDNANGIVAQALLDNQTAVMKKQYDATLGSAINSKGHDGVINSSVMNKSILNAQDSLNNAVANNYTNNLVTQNNSLGQQSNLVNNQVTANNNAQAGSFVNLDKLYGYATGTPYTTSTNNATSTANSQQTYATEDPGLGGSLIGGIATVMACFIAGTKISTPDGDKNIEDIKVGDIVCSLNDTVETVIYTMNAIISPDDYMHLKGECGAEVTTTSTQAFITDNGDILSPDLIDKLVLTKNDKEKIISITPAEKELVYDLSTTGSNSYFANGFAVRGE